MSAPGIAGDISDLADINATQLTTLKRAMNSYHVREARKRIDESDLSKSDYAFMMELAREGILEPKLLKFALMTTPGTKYYRCLLYTSPSPRDATLSRMPSSA